MVIEERVAKRGFKVADLDKVRTFDAALDGAKPLMISFADAANEALSASRLVGFREKPERAWLKRWMLADKTESPRIRQRLKSTARKIAWLKRKSATSSIGAKH